MWRHCDGRRYAASTSRGGRDAMRTLCTLAIMIAGAGLIAGVPSRDAQACDDDRYPCPVREQAVQETADAPAKPPPPPKKRKGNNNRANKEASAKREAR